MDKNAIKKYAVWARRELISRVSQKALQYGISDKEIVPAAATSVNGIVLSAEEIKQRRALIDQITSKGYAQVMEEVAYTWFNRFIALRFMEVNGYLPSRVRVFTDENNVFNPQILTEAISLELDGLDMEKVYALKDANDNEGLFKYLIIVQCNALSPILPRMFQRISDYTELLFPDNLLREGSAIEQMIAMIPEEDWKDAVQIIGWLYQFYNIEPKAEVFAKNGKITKEEIPAATQLFTPDWIVRYMVENSLGRLWLEHLAASGEGYHYCYDENGNNVASSVITSAHVQQLKSNWKYYLDEAEQKPEVQEQLAVIRKEYASMSPEQIKCIDPCAGSGHILAYIFDVLMQIYEAYGYTAREAVRSIVENNIYGLDIDERAAQLAYFSVMMKARQYDRRYLTRKDEDGNPDVPQSHVYAIVESNCIDVYALEYFINGDPKLKEAMDSIIKEMRDAKDYGSILDITPVDFIALFTRFAEVQDDISISREAVLMELLPMVKVAAILAQDYDIVVTNPPYLNSGKMNPRLSNYVKKHYPGSKADMYAVFLEKGLKWLKRNSYLGLINQQAWMFLNYFEELRKNVLAYTIVNMEHLGARAFAEIGGEVVQTTAFVIRKSHCPGYEGKYMRLTSFDSEQLKADHATDKAYEYLASQNKYQYIPGNALAYWISDETVSIFRNEPQLKTVAEPRAGLQTGENDTFLRLWPEIAFPKMGFGCADAGECIASQKKWFPYSKGGGFRRWYGNYEYVVNWYNDGEDIRQDKLTKLEAGLILSSNSKPKNVQYYFRDGITWSTLSSAAFAARWHMNGGLFDIKGSTCFFDDAETQKYVMGLMNSKPFNMMLQVISPTLDYNAGYIGKVPVKIDRSKIQRVSILVDNCIDAAKHDWDMFEASWDFQRHPLILAIPGGEERLKLGNIRLSECFRLWIDECTARFMQLKTNEEEINDIFISVYCLQNELSPTVEDKDVTVRLADKKRDIRSLISYAVGCMFGRYSLDVPGLIYAGGNIDEVYQKDVLGDGQGNAITFGGVRIAVSNAYTRVKVGDNWVDCTIPVDADNIIPICDDEYFTDDIVSRFIRFIETVYGKDTLQENLRFIADALGGSGQPKDVIRNYFLNDFYADHLKIYQKRPIYWMFDSGKKGGFRALVYMHRYQPDTIARMRTDYVHEQQARYRTAIADLEQRIATASTSERVKLSKRLKKLQEQAAEIQGYEEKIHHLADQYIEIDLDDGIKKNYEIFKDVLAKIK